MKITFVLGAISFLATTSTVTAVMAKSNCVHNDVGLDMATSTLEYNNLGGVGPDYDAPEEMRFADVGTFHGRTLDFVAKIKDGETYEPAKNTKNGLLCGITAEGKPDLTSCTTGAYFGQINMKRNRETTVIFEIQDNETHEPVTLPGFVFSLFDIDQGVVEHYRVTDWTTAQYDHENTEAYFTETEGFCEDFPDTNCIYGRSTHVGAGCDNPTDPMELGVVHCKNRDVDQKARSFQLTFENKSSLEVFFYYEASEGDNGRNVVFSFNSALSEECPTPDPRVTDDLFFDDALCVEDL